MLTPFRSLTLAALVLAGCPAFASAQDEPMGRERVYRLLTTEDIEQMLGNLKVEFKKVNSQTRGDYFYDFTRKNYKVRLTSFGGKDVMLDAVFKAIPLERLNEWNRKAKFSRVSLIRDKAGEYVVIEYNLDVVGGITEGTVKQFFTQFDRELQEFDRFVGSNLQLDQNILAAVTPDVLDGLLKKMNLKFDKKENKTNTSYDFELNGMKVRLYSFAGKDLMIDCVFRKVPLEAVNKYNIDRKFIRAVYYNTNGNEYTALEGNLDCVAGVTEGMLRHFITSFGEDAKHFSGYMQNVK